MTQEEKELLLKDLCARLPYGVICKVEFKDSDGWKIQNMSLEGVFINECYFTTDTGSIYSKEFKPYLRPMSSMTEEERNELIRLGGIVKIDTGEVIDISCLGFKHHANNQDWLNAHHFDYRGLIEKGFALEAPEGMYKID